MPEASAIPDITDPSFSVTDHADPGGKFVMLTIMVTLSLLLSQITTDDEIIVAVGSQIDTGALVPHSAVLLPVKSVFTKLAANEPVPSLALKYATSPGCGIAVHPAESVSISAGVRAPLQNLTSSMLPLKLVLLTELKLPREVVIFLVSRWVAGKVMAVDPIFVPSR